MTSEEFDKKISASDKEELKRLDKWGDLLNGMMEISNLACVIGLVSLFTVMFGELYSQSIGIFTNVAISLVCVLQPWIIWAIRYMGITVSFNITNLMLITSGIFIGIIFIDSNLSFLIDKANMDVDMILSKYDREDDSDE